jgi:phosphotransferase system enzyme I (PtsP)
MDVMMQRLKNSEGSDQRSFDLLCNMAELTSIFERKGSIAEFLGDVVEMVSQHMHSEVCSIYLYEHGRDRLILRATKGLNASMIDDLELEVGEGITGISFKEIRPIREGKASQSPFFKAVPGSAEENFEAFLAVPIRRGVNKIGVITLQHSKANYFTKQDTRALRAIASQLAAVLENAEVLMELYQDRKQAESRLPEVVPGVGAGRGICIGKSVVLRRKAQSFRKMSGASVNIDGVAVLDLPESDTRSDAQRLTDELTRFAMSLSSTKDQLEDIQRSLGDSIAEVADLIFSAHMLMLRDDKFSGAMQEAIENGSSSEEAIQSVVNRYVELFSSQSNPRIQEKTQDVLDLGHRLIRNLESDSVAIRRDFSGQIIVAADIFPSEIVKFAAEKAEGLVMLGGGQTAHVALLARSLNLPTIFVKETAILDLEDDVPLIIDVDAGKLFIKPAAAVEEQYKQIRRDYMRRSAVVIDIPERCQTKDGTRVSILANVNLVQDVKFAVEQKAEGIGLYRSEFPFLVRNDFPSEEDQTSIYRRVLEPMGKKEVIFRTLDVGGDKLIGYNAEHREANPFLGYRGIRFSLGNHEIFLEQIRAILRAGLGSNVGIMFPMISSLEEYQDARDMVYRAMEDLRRDRIEFNESPRLGAMIELPAAAEIAGELAEESDFLSIGTNDLIMYLLAVDRTNEKVENMYRPYHPAVLRVINRITENVGAKISELSVCGEAGADPALLPFLLGRGIRKISVDPKKISDIKTLVSDQLHLRAEQLSKEMLTLRKLCDLENYMQEHMGFTPGRSGR